MCTVSASAIVAVTSISASAATIASRPMVDRRISDREYVPVILSLLSSKVNRSFVHLYTIRDTCILRYKRPKNVTETYTRYRASNKILGHFSRLLAQSLVHSTLTQHVLKSNERESRRIGNAQAERK